MRDYRLGAATFTLLRAEVSPQTSEKDALQVRLRMMNHDRYDTNFWDRSFRLIVDGVPLAPEGGLNELVPGQSAKEGDVMFGIPRGTTAATLKITYIDQSTEIPLNLKAPRSCGELEVRRRIPGPRNAPPTLAPRRELPSLAPGRPPKGGGRSGGHGLRRIPARGRATGL